MYKRANQSQKNLPYRAITTSLQQKKNEDLATSKNSDTTEAKLLDNSHSITESGNISQLQRHASLPIAPISYQQQTENSTVQRMVEEEEEEDVLQGKFKGIAQRMEEEEEEDLLQGKFSQTPIQKQEKPVNNTGLPDKLKSGIENLSGYSMDDVKVHYNSSKPAQLQAHAYAQGTDIHLGPGQEKHLPHEAWHVVQQKQGRVKPTMQLKGIGVNDDVGLEREADVVGKLSTSSMKHPKHKKKTVGDTQVVTQLMKGWLGLAATGMMNALTRDSTDTNRVVHTDNEVIRGNVEGEQLFTPTTLNNSLINEEGHPLTPATLTNPLVNEEPILTEIPIDGVANIKKNVKKAIYEYFGELIEGLTQAYKNSHYGTQKEGTLENLERESLNNWISKTLNELHEQSEAKLYIKTVERVNNGLILLNPKGMGYLSVAAKIQLQTNMLAAIEEEADNLWLWHIKEVPVFLKLAGEEILDGNLEGTLMSCFGVFLNSMAGAGNLLLDGLIGMTYEKPGREIFFEKKETD